MKRKYETSEKYNARIIKLIKPKALETMLNADAKDEYENEPEAIMNKSSVMVKFPKVGALLAKGYLYTSENELIAQCCPGDVVIFDCDEQIKISAHIKGYFGTPEIMVQAGDVIKVECNLAGKIRFSTDENKYRKWLSTIQKVNLIDSKDEAPKITTKQSGVSAAARAVLGGALLGDIGAIAGAASTKQKTVITKGKRAYKFYVLYEDGTDDILVLVEGEKCDDLLKLSYRQEAEK